MRVPSNIIQTGKYTVGKEFIDKKTYKPYQGYYYEINGKTFAGKEFNTNAPEIVKISSLISNSLFGLGTVLFGKLSKLNLTSDKPSSFFYNYQGSIRYFLFKNIPPSSITEVNKDTFENFQNNTLYNSVALSYEGGFNDNELKEAENKIPGITTFVNTSYTPPPVEESGLIG